MSHFMTTYAPWAAAALVAVAVANLIRVALRNDRRRPRYRVMREPGPGERGDR